MRKSFINYIPWEMSFSFLIIILVFLLLPFLYIFFTGAIISSFKKLGFSFLTGMLLFIFTLLGSVINIPVKTISSGTPIYSEQAVDFFGVRYRIPVLLKEETLVSVNFGGAIIPIIISGYEFMRILASGSTWSIFAVFIAIAIVSIVVHYFARPVKGLGIAVPIFIPPLITVLTVYLLNPGILPAVAYISGTLGTLIGADLLNLKNINNLGAPIVSIGGAGTFDGIFLTGIISVLLI